MSNAHKHCLSCGHHLSESDRYCPQCGLETVYRKLSLRF
ncbi:MAG: zinc-ribbon domain-containing protein [Saprospiraceae bacterium]